MKALGLALYRLIGARQQIGVSQYTNIAALKTHLKFAPLSLIDPLTSMHTRAGETFIYHLEIPSLSTLFQYAGLSAQAHVSAEDKTHKKNITDAEHSRWIQATHIQTWKLLRTQLFNRSLRTLQIIQVKKGPEGVEIKVSIN